jgi:hypothetical protein
VRVTKLPSGQRFASWGQIGPLAAPEPRETGASRPEPDEPECPDPALSDGGGPPDDPELVWATLPNPLNEKATPSPQRRYRMVCLTRSGSVERTETNVQPPEPFQRQSFGEAEWVAWPIAAMMRDAGPKYLFHRAIAWALVPRGGQAKPFSVNSLRESWAMEMVRGFP